MANQAKLEKIAKEGFSVIDQFYNQNRMQESQVHEYTVPKSYPIFWAWRCFAAPKTMDSNQAAKRFGGVVIAEGRRKTRK